MPRIAVEENSRMSLRIRAEGELGRFREELSGFVLIEYGSYIVSVGMFVA